ncbi:MAG TPA: hypothetical protein VGH01_08995 [Jatrophihabitantaceae bacterium]|jgi:very-short-patch-repair endonuclease
MAGLHIAGPARAIADAALDCRELSSARALVTASVQRGLCSTTSLLSEYQSGPRNGSYFLRRAVLDVLDGAHSVAEAEAMDVLVDAALPTFELNVALADQSGRVRFVADVLWRSLRAVLEIDSRAHHGNEADRLATMARHNRLAAAGLVVVHWAPTVIRGEPHGFAHQVKEWLVRRAAELNTELPPGTGPIRPPGGASPQPFVVPGL